MIELINYNCHCQTFTVFIAYLIVLFFCFQVSLERVIGLTVSTNATLACDPTTGTIAYPAGCVYLACPGFNAMYINLLLRSYLLITQYR